VIVWAFWTSVLSVAVVVVVVDEGADEVVVVVSLALESVDSDAGAQAAAINAAPARPPSKISDHL